MNFLTGPTSDVFRIKIFYYLKDFSFKTEKCLSDKQILITRDIGHRTSDIGRLF